MLENGRRLIGRYTGQHRGPLMICFGGLHGNEMAGIKALDLVFKMLEVEPITNPDFQFKGRIVGFRGNLSALDAGDRYIARDINRMWDQQTVMHVLQTPMDELTAEEKELRELIRACQLEISNYDPASIIVLDLHTTSCHGGIFSIVREDWDSIELGIELHAPVVRGMLKGLDGTTLHYFHQDNFQVPITSISFESGQHDNPLSINRAIAAIINCMRTSGLVKHEHVENQHDKLLIEHSENLPKVCQLVYGHKINADDEFVMKPGFKNFDYIETGEHLADDKNGPILAKTDGLILMPLYQKQGSDGFFVIEAHDPSTLPER